MKCLVKEQNIDFAVRTASSSPPHKSVYTKMLGRDEGQNKKNSYI